MSAAEDTILADLNPPQREAVATLQGPLLILAGAGSGKTRVVTRRIANLLAHGARPWEILAITFTNKAAEEMRRRVDTLVGGEGGTSGVWLSTFHSFCARVLRREAEALGLTRDFTIYDEDDASAVLKDIVKRLGMADDKRFSPRNVRQTISRLKNQALRTDELTASGFHDRIVSQIFEQYEAELKKNQALDFDDLLRHAVLLFSDHPDILERYRGRFRYVLVDEYQDTNKCQYLLVKLLGEKHRNVCATGDPDQSIYGWRGADVRNILSFERDFPEAKVVKLEQNYRSTQTILNAAGSVIDHNRERKKKSLWTENAPGDRITFTVAGDEQLEAYEVARQIEQQVAAGRRCSDIAIFYRTNAQSRALEEALRTTNIPHTIVGGITFYERREVKDTLAYLRLIINPKDNVSFRRVINVPKRGLGDSAVELLEVQAAQAGVALTETLSGPDAETFIGTFKPKPRLGLVKFAKLYDKLRAMPPFPVVPLVKTVLEDSGLRAMLAESGELERVENVEALVDAAAAFDEEMQPLLADLDDSAPAEPGANDGLEEFAQQQASLAGFLERVALMAPTDDYDPEKEYVTLMTLHMAKGLEFPVVCITGMEEGLLPLLRAADDSAALDERGEDTKAIEEERRLAYVGMTRAKEKLYLSRAQFRRRYGKSEMAVPSRFLDEIPDKLLDVQDRMRPAFLADAGNFPRAGGMGFQPMRRKHGLEAHATGDDDEAFTRFEKEVGDTFSDEAPAPPPRRDPALAAAVDRLLDTSDTQLEAGDFEIGDRVRHPTFGPGVIEALTGAGLSRKVKVHFRQHGPKLLLLNLAKLERI